MVSQNVVTGIATCFVYIGLELITVRMDLIKSGLSLHKHKHSKILIPTNIFMAQIEENYISDFQIDVEKMEEETARFFSPLPPPHPTSATVDANLV